MLQAHISSAYQKSFYIMVKKMKSIKNGKCLNMIKERIFYSKRIQSIYPSFLRTVYWMDNVIW